MVSISPDSCWSRHFSATYVLCFEDFVEAAALVSLHGTEMEEIILGVVCTKSRLAVFLVWFLLGQCLHPQCIQQWILMQEECFWLLYN